MIRTSVPGSDPPDGNAIVKRTDCVAFLHLQDRIV
jgi:hypothetical protein